LGLFQQPASRTAWHVAGLLAFLLLAPSARADEPGASRDLKGHGGPVRAIVISPDGAQALTASFDYSVIHWRLSPAPGIASRFLYHNGPVNDVALVPGSRLAVAGSDDKTVGVFDLDTGEPVGRLQGHGQKVVAVAASPDGAMAASAAWDHTARLWDLHALAPGPVLDGHDGNVNDVVFSHDGKSVFTAGYDGTIRQWRVDDGSERLVYSHGWGINAVHPAPDGTALLFGATDGTAGLVDIASGAVRRLVERDEPIVSLAVSPDGLVAAIGGVQGSIDVFDAGSWRRLNQFENPYGPIWALAIAADGNGLYFAGLDDDVHYWQFRPGRDFEPAIGDYPRRFQVRDGLDPGERQFARKCSVCHTLTRDGANRAGPTLYRLFGRRAGSLENYPYSEALQRSDIVWTPETLGELFAQGPEHYVPGSKMPLQMMAEKRDLEALIAFLQRATDPRE
jgi:cytochrome c